VIAGLFAEVFDIPAVGVDDDFFHLGGDSLVAGSLLAAIERRFGRILSMSILLEAPTPRKLADRIVQAVNSDRALRSIVPIKTDGIPPTVFCVHGTSGESLFPRGLAVALQSRPIYAYRAIGLEKDELPLTSIEAMAKDYLEGIYAVAPKGPILLIGHCDGSLVAYEMARQLEAAGRPAAGLVMIDPSADEERAPQLHHAGLELMLKRSRLRQKAERLRARVDAVSEANGADRWKTVFQGMSAAATLYELKPLGVRVLLFCTPERREHLLDPRLGFPAFALNLEAVDLTVEHFEMFSKEFRKIAAEIDAFVTRLGVG
jgi:thioesterase domain-containing protein/acyl carrier protein